MNSTLSSPSLAHAQGALLGAFIGDAAGATLEFIGHRPSAAEVANALTLCGAGVFKLAPGQITDDGELAVALGRALAGERSYPLEAVAESYRAWAASPPFDIGQATSAALRGRKEETESAAACVARHAAAHNMASKANGALMRASPLGIWSARQPFETAVAAARADARLTHPNPSCQWANAAYVAAIRHLLLDVEDGAGAFQDAQMALDGASDEGADEVRAWLADAERAHLPACHPQAGFVRIAFTHAFHHLLRATSFAGALEQVLGAGGDTDTNACIVGALVGARVGISGIAPHRCSPSCTATRRRGVRGPPGCRRTMH